MYLKLIVIFLCFLTLSYKNVNGIKCNNVDYCVNRVPNVQSFLLKSNFTNKKKNNLEISDHQTHIQKILNWTLLKQANNNNNYNYNNIKSKNQVKFFDGNNSDDNDNSLHYIPVINFGDNTSMISNSDENNKNINNKSERVKTYEEGLLRNLASKLFEIQTPFDPSKSSLTSETCKADTKKYFDSLKILDLWALQMFDSSAKLSSGILNGNVNQLGHFDECLKIDNGDNINGQYCLAYIQPEVSENFDRLKFLHKRIQSHYAFKSQFDDPGHRVPRYSTINWALCVPSSCSHKDVENSLHDYVYNLTVGTGIQLKIRVDKEMCQQRSDKSMDLSTKIAGSFFILIVTISLLSTIYELKYGNKNQWFVAFSLNKNTQALFSMTREINDIKSIHGIRFINAIMLIIAHRSMALFFIPYTNRTQMAEQLGQPWTVIGRAASLYTDPFIMLSGLLTTYSLIGRLQKGNSVQIRQEYIGRLLRIVPTLGALILFCTYILPLMGSGPQWNLVITHHSDICKSYWWRNLLFIHNYFGFENMCLTHTHHVGIDTQLFLLAPFMALLLWKWPKRGVTLLLTIAVISTIARFHVTITRRLSNYVFFGTSVSQLFDTANYMYILPAHRLTVYIMGVLLGFILRTKKDIKLTKTLLRIGWYVNTALLLAAFFGPAPMGNLDYIYNPTHAAHYAAFAPIAWCSFFAWIIFTSHLGYNCIVSQLLSWRGFQIATRLSYAVYLTQFPVFFYNVGRVRSAEYYSFFTHTINIYELFWVFITSIILTLLFDSPFQNIKKIFFQSPLQPKFCVSEKIGKMKNNNTKLVYDTQEKKNLKL